MTFKEKGSKLKARGEESHNNMFFKVKIGFDADDFISITQDELPMAVRAQINGTIGIFSEGSVAGNNIMSIIPDWNREMGWKRQYKLVDEDYEQIGNRRIEESRILLENVKRTALGLPEIKIPQQISAESKQLANKFQIT